MGFSFGLFRFLTFGNLFILGIFLVIMLMSLAFTPALSMALVYLVLMGGSFYHNILSSQLQRALLEPGYTPKPSFAQRMNVTQLVGFIYAALVLVNALFSRFVPEEDLTKAIEMSGPQAAELTPELLRNVMTTVSVLLGLHALAVAVNCSLSRKYMREWRNRQQKKENDLFQDEM
ncbi:hypothetical protein ACWKWU_18755 [Chitinophaga lutea]